jgi:hypothetical protein
VPTTAVTSSYVFEFQDYTSANYKVITMHLRTGNSAGSENYSGYANCNSTSAISSIQISTNAGTASYNGGTYILYGVK